MEAEVDQQLGAEKNQRTDGRSGYIENLSRSQVSEMTKGLNEQVEEFRNRSLAGAVYPQAYHFRCSLRAGFGNP